MSNTTIDPLPYVTMPQPSRLALYPASHTHLARFWLDLAGEWKEVDFVARWPKALTSGRPDEPEYAELGWGENLEDVALANVVMCYSDSYQPLRGALVECGMGLALRKRILLVGANPSFGTWQFHRYCYAARDLDHARDLLAEWNENGARW